MTAWIWSTIIANLIAAFVLLALPWVIKLALDTWAGQQRKDLQ